MPMVYGELRTGSGSEGPPEPGVPGQRGLASAAVTVTSTPVFDALAAEWTRNPSQPRRSSATDAARIRAEDVTVARVASAGSAVSEFTWFAP
jgi:hypothetical protein